MRMLTTIGLSLAVLIVSANAWAKHAQATDHPMAHGGKVRPTKVAAQDRESQAGRRHLRRLAADKTLARAQHPQRDKCDLPPTDKYIGRVRVIGPREVGTAAWYGGRHIGARTASGERLDDIHLTAAHRTLPLHSMVRVTNLRNGRSAIVTINDRGPVSHSLLIDLSPRVADELEMRRAGLARVSVEPITETATASR